MMPMAAGLHAALRLARGRSDGVLLLGDDASDTLAAARRSFWAAAFCLPAFVCLHLLETAPGTGLATAAHDFALDLLGFVIGWAGFALVSCRVAARIGRAALWPRFITLWNWCNLIQYLMLVTASLPGLLGLPDLVGETAWLVAIGWALWLEWFATRLTLAVPALAAAALVALDVSIGLFVSGITG
jgi:hypothetical protein